MNTCEVCQIIISLTQTYTLGQRLMVNTPEELFYKFMQLSVSLLDYATTWPIQLCLTYYSALDKDLVESTTSDSIFKMPMLTTLTTKAV